MLPSTSLIQLTKPTENLYRSSSAILLPVSYIIIELLLLLHRVCIDRTVPRRLVAFPKMTLRDFDYRRYYYTYTSSFGIKFVIVFVLTFVHFFFFFFFMFFDVSFDRQIHYTLSCTTVIFVRIKYVPMREKNKRFISVKRWGGESLFMYELFPVLSRRLSVS